MIFDSANYADYHQNHMTNSNEPYRCLSVSKELSFCLDPGKDKIHKEVYRIFYVRAKGQKTKPFSDSAG